MSAYAKGKTCCAGFAKRSLKLTFCSLCENTGGVLLFAFVLTLYLFISHC